MEENRTTEFVTSSEFKKETLDKMLIDLRQRDIIPSDEVRKQLFDFYMKDQRDLQDIIADINNLNTEDIQKKLNIKKEEEAPQANKISLDNVTDFYNEDIKKSYILIHFPYPSTEIKVVENNTGKSAKELFESFKDSEGLVSVDGFVESQDVFKNSIEPEKKEVKMYDVTELCKNGSFNKLTEEQQKMVIAVVNAIINELAGISKEQKEKLRKTPIVELIKMLDKNVYFSPEENIVIISVPEDITKDQIQTVSKDAEGKYKLTALNATGYSYVSENNELNNNDNQSGPAADDNEEVEKENDEFGVDKVKKKKKPSFWDRNKKDAA